MHEKVIRVSVSQLNASMNTHTHTLHIHVYIPFVCDVTRAICNKRQQWIILHCVNETINQNWKWFCLIKQRSYAMKMDVRRVCSVGALLQCLSSSHLAKNVPFLLLSLFYCFTFVCCYYAHANSSTPRPISCNFTKLMKPMQIK